MQRPHTPPGPRQGAPLAHGVVLRPAHPAPASVARLSDAQRLFRAELGLPADRPVIMGGHQAGLWHPGIAAKWFAACAIAETHSGTPAWLIVDYDDDRADTIAYPTKDLRRAVARGTPPGQTALPRNAAAMTGLLLDADKDPPHPRIAERLHALDMALRAHGRNENLVMQTFRLSESLLAQAQEPAGVMRPVRAADLSATSLFANIVKAIAGDADNCIRAYNAASAKHPRAGIRPLEQSGSSAELPFWHAPPGGGRRRVRLGELSGLPVRELVPTALLLTGLVRLGACDLFIHGIGGELYDPATEDWFLGWPGAMLAASCERLAPSVVVSATLTLPIASEAGSLPEFAPAAWLAHAAKHQPALVGDAVLAAEREKHLADIRTARSRGANPVDAYRELHALLSMHRTRNDAAIRALSQAAETAKSSRERRAVALDRTWSIALHEATALAGLRASVRSELDSFR